MTDKELEIEIASLKFEHNYLPDLWKERMKKRSERPAKLCPMCIMHVGTIPPERMRLCVTHRRGENLSWSSKRELNPFD